MKKNIKFIYGALIITVLGSGLALFILNQNNKNDYQDNFKSTRVEKTIKPSIDSKNKELEKNKNRIENEITSGLLKAQKKNYEYTGPGLSSKTIYLDRSGQVVKYTKEAGSEDSTITHNFYYDQNNQLFYVLITGGASNGLDENDKPISSELKHEIYFEKGQRISENEDITGPGYDWPKIWPETEMIFAPLVEYNLD